MSTAIPGDDPQAGDSGRRKSVPDYRTPEQKKKSNRRWFTFIIVFFVLNVISVCGLPFLNVLFGDAVGETLGASDGARTKAGVALYFSGVFGQFCFTIVADIFVLMAAGLCYYVFTYKPSTTPSTDDDTLTGRGDS